MRKQTGKINSIISRARGWRFSAPEALRKLAGGGTTGTRQHKDIQPRQGRQTTRSEFLPDALSCAPSGRGPSTDAIPVVPPPANFRSPFGAKKRFGHLLIIGLALGTYFVLTPFFTL